MNTKLPLSVENAKRALLAGKAIVTLKNTTTDNHFTYKIKQASNRDGSASDRFFVSVLSGPDNNTNYRYAGLISMNNKSLTTTKNSKVGEDAPSFRVFRTVVNNLFAGSLEEKFPSVQIWHEGKCCKCGKKLTDPDSLSRGLGPHCASY